MSPSSAGVSSSVASSVGSGVTVLRVKRPRNRAPLSALNVTLPSFKPDRLSHAFTSLSLTTSKSRQHVRFRRLAASRAHAALAAPGVTVVDVDVAALRRGVKRPADHEDPEGEARAKVPRVKGPEKQQQFLCNGLPMLRVPAHEEDLYVQDEQRAALGVHDGDTDGDDPCSDGEMAYLKAEDVPQLVFEEERSEEECDEDDDLDGESVDYPSTPESEGNTPEDDEDPDDDDDARRRPFGVGGAEHSFGLGGYGAYDNNADQYEDEGYDGDFYEG